MPGRSATAKLELGRASFPAAAVALALLGQRGAINLALATAVVYAMRMLALPDPLDWSLLGAAAVLAWGNALSLYSPPRSSSTSRREADGRTQLRLDVVRAQPSGAGVLG